MSSKRAGKLISKAVITDVERATWTGLSATYYSLPSFAPFDSTAWDQLELNLRVPIRNAIKEARRDHDW